jgi:translation initiation factor IF-2
VVKTRVHDLAAEFGVSAEQLMNMLKDMNIFVRSHMSPLEDGQVSAVRVRWEREKRKAAQASEEPAKKGRKKATKTVKAVKAEEPEPAGEAGKPAKRRRTAAEVAQAEAVLEAERVAESLREAALGLTKPVEIREEPMLPSSIEERARALFKDLPPMPADTTEEPVVVPASIEPRRPAPPRPESGETLFPPRPSAPPARLRPACRPASPPGSPGRPRLRAAAPESRGSTGRRRCSARALRPARASAPRGVQRGVGGRPARAAGPAARSAPRRRRPRSSG